MRSLRVCKYIINEWMAKESMSRLNASSVRAYRMQVAVCDPAFFSAGIIFLLVYKKLAPIHIKNTSILQNELQ